MNNIMATVIIVSAAVSIFGWIMYGIGFYVGYKSSVSNRL